MITVNDRRPRLASAHLSHAVRRPQMKIRLLPPRTESPGPFRTNIRLFRCFRPPPAHLFPTYISIARSQSSMASVIDRYARAPTLVAATSPTSATSKQSQPLECGATRRPSHDLPMIDSIEKQRLVDH